MPSPESVRKSTTQDVSAMTPADTAATCLDPVDMALPPGAPDTAATRALWAALAAHVTATAAELAHAAEGPGDGCWRSPTGRSRATARAS